MNKERCECHECTQIRYKTSFQYQLERATEHKVGGELECMKMIEDFNSRTKDPKESE